MTNLMSSLGLENVESDPNAIPDGKYDGVVFKSEYVLSKNKDTVSHVITYQVTGEDHKGAQRAQWFTLGSEPRDAEGNFPGSIDAIAKYNPIMSESQKSWYKKAFVDLGVPEQDVHTTPIASLVGKPVTFGVKKKDGYVNINFVELRQETAEAPVSLDSNNLGSLL